MFEQVKDYKSACAILGKKPIDKRRKLDEHVMLYIMLVLSLKQLTLLLMETNCGYQSTNKINLSEHGTVGGTLIGIRLKMVLLRVYSIWILTMALVVRLLLSVLI